MQVMQRINRFTLNGSGWIIQRITAHKLLINQYKPLRGKSYINLPDWINNKPSTINIQNKDDKGFIYCLGRRFDPNPEEVHLERLSKHFKKSM